MPSFVFSPLLWGLLAVAAPLLIHLINMMRHKRIHWAAMEFLLQSQKRNRTWVMLKQLLLLLLRMAAIAAVVFLVAQPLFRESFGSIFGGGSKTHHIVLLDDSFSMSDTSNGPSAFDKALQVTGQLGQFAINSSQESPQVFTLLRFSQAKQNAGASRPDLTQQAVNGDFKKLLDDKLKTLKVSELATGPQAALNMIARQMDQAKDEKRIVYLVTDIRNKQWDNPVELRKTLTDLSEAGVQLRFVQCADAFHPNLAITALEPEAGTKAAGVPLFMQVAVKNFGANAAKQVAISLEEDGKSRPGVKIDDIPPGKTAVERYQVFFADPGVHRLRAYLPGADAIGVDNQRFAAVNFVQSAPVLLVDGDNRAAKTRGDSYYLYSALTPGGQVNTGIRPRIETARYLENHSLDEFEAIYVLNAERMEQNEIAALEDYAKKGGGVAFFMGPLCSAKFFNDNLYRDGEGIFPLPLAGPTDLLVDRTEKAPDMEVTQNPIFSIFTAERNSFINSVSIDKYFAAQKDWVPPANATTKVIARTRNGAPLAVEHKFGEGRVVAFLTTAAPVWNNWGRDNPSFVVTMLQLQAYLSARPEVVRLVGSPLTLKLDRAKYKAPFSLTPPNQGQQIALSYADDEAARAKPYFEVTISEDTTRASGFYELALPRLDQATETVESQSLAYNVTPEEGDLRLLDEPQLRTQLKSLPFKYYTAAQLQFDSTNLAGVNLSRTWEYLFLLILLLLGEQVLAYSASYHPANRAMAKGLVAA
ncbi:MAG TPA: BatA domain-containing protein [Pirellulales bacterium]|jgi:hypothetical protein|nr:BatA domain-containing protein [Pirellulales bacterium]